MGEFKGCEDGRPVFTSNGVRVLMAAAGVQVSMLEPEFLNDTFGAELIVDNMTINPYWQIGEVTGGIYRLEHFPIDGTEHDYQGLLIFNAVPSEEYRKACQIPENNCVGSICDIIVGYDLFQGFSHADDEWTLSMPDDIDKAVIRANKPLQAILDKLAEEKNPA